MSTVINTSDDLLKLLTENAEFYQAVRRLILTDELIELPAKFAKFADRVETFITQQEQFNEEQRQFNHRIEGTVDELRAGQVRQEGAIDELRAGQVRQEGAIDELRASQARQEVAIDELRAGQARQEVAIDELRASQARQEVAIGELKGNTARYVVSVLFYEIAEHLGFTFQDALTRRELNAMIGPQGYTDVSSGDRQSFVRADLVVMTTNADGDTHYIAVEASYTADERDTRRARRNADLLRRFTGCPAHAVIASVRNVDSVQAEIDDGTIHWYTLNPDDFTPQ